MASPSSTTDLLRRIADEDAAALRELHGEMANVLFGLIFNILKDRQEAEDCLQETFLKIWKKAPRYDAALGGASSWLTTIARNAAVDKYRSRVRQSTAQGEAKEDLIQFTTLESDSGADVTEARERKVEIRQALSQLSTEQRQAIELAFFSGHTQREVSEYLGVPLGTVKARIRRGMQTLRPLLSSAS